MVINFIKNVFLDFKSRHERRNFPYLTHPLVLAALIITAVNDHYLKYQFHNFYTGKISDFSGLFFFPLFLYALIEFLKAPRALHRVIDKKQILLMIIATDIIFVFFKYTVLREHLVSLFPLSITPDYSDLMAVVVNWPTYLIARKYFI